CPPAPGMCGYGIRSPSSARFSMAARPWRAVQVAAALAVLSVDADDRAHGAFLLDGDVGDGAVEALGPHGGPVPVLDLGLAQQDEAPVAGDLGGAADDGLDEGGAGCRDPGGDDSGGDVDGAEVECRK